MQYWLKRGLAGLAVLVLAVGAVVLWRAWTASADQPSPAGLSSVNLEERATVARLSRALRFRTVSYTDRSRIDRESFRAFNAWLVEAFPRVHAALEREVVNGYSLLYTWRGTDRSLAPVVLAAHSDVVPADEDSRWRHPPFSGLAAEGAVWGRGALDDKASLVGILEAVEALLAAGHRPARTVHLAFGHDEEVGGREGAARIASLLARRGIEPAMVLDEGSWILEGVLPGDFPVAGIAVSEKGYVSLDLSATGRGGHSSVPPRMTAAGRIARAVERVQSRPFPARLTPPVRALLETIAPRMSFGSRLLLTNLWLFEPLVIDRFAGTPKTDAAIRTTIAPTMLSGSVKDNVLPESAGAVINFRILPGDSVERVTARVRQRVDDDRVTVSARDGFGADPSPVSDMDSPAFRAIGATARALDPSAVVAPMLMVAAADARHYADIARDVYRFMPLRVTPELIETFHGRNEHIPVADYLKLIRGYATLLEHPWVAGGSR